MLCRGGRVIDGSERRGGLQPSGCFVPLLPRRTLQTFHEPLARQEELASEPASTPTTARHFRRARPRFFAFRPRFVGGHGTEAVSRRVFNSPQSARTIGRMFDNPPRAPEGRLTVRRSRPTPRRQSSPRQATGETARSCGVRG